MSQLYAPLRKQLTRLIPQATNLQQSTDLVIKALQKTTTDSDEVEKDFIQFAEHLITFLQTVRRVGGYSQELAEMPNVADKLADVAMTLKGLEMVGSLDYIGLARMLETVQGPDVVRLAIQELRSYPDGAERIEWLREAVNE